MRINKLLFKSINNKVMNTNELKEGSIIRGRIVEIFDDFIKLDLGNGNYLTGKSLISLNKNKGEAINFLVKSIDQSRIILSPIPNEIINEKRNEIYFKNLLTDLNMEFDEKNLQIVKTLIKFNMPLQKSTIEHIEKVINKLEGLTNIKEHEVIQLINDKNPLKNEITNLYKVDLKNELPFPINQENIKENIEIVTFDKQNTNKIIQELNSIIKDSKIDTNIIEKIAFLIKTGFRVSVNNLKYITNLTEGNWFIEKDIEQLLQLLNKESKLLEKFNNPFKNLPFSVDLKADGDSIKETIKKYYDNINDDINEIKAELKEENKIEKTIIGKIEELGEKMYFLNKLNESNTFMYIPFLFQPWGLKEKLYLLNKTKKRNCDRITIFMSLETKNLKNVEALCSIISNSININFTLEEKETMSFLEKNEKRLRDTLSECGFNNINIKFGLKEGETKILHILSDNNIITNSLDIKV